jgi:putative redox protein
MNFQKVTFTNREGEELVGRLELPIDRRPHNFVVFAHCFTCTKNLIAIRNIARELVREGFGVLRFDFTGLGESEGEFENTNFSGNVDDLIDAANYLKEEYAAPTLIIGHSLGGSAAIFAAEQIPSVKAVAVINSPSNPEHVKNLVKDDIETIRKNGKARVNIGGRDFTLKKQFLDDIKNHPLTEVVANFRKSLLILHSPQDRIVGIENAKDLFIAAWHPKSYISLDGMDHMLSGQENSHYVGKVITGWAMRYVSMPKGETLQSNKQVAARLDNTEKFTTYMKLGDHNALADEPTTYGGNNFGPSPYEYLSGALASCTAMTVQMYARRKKWNLENITVHIDHSKEHAVDCENCESSSAKIDTFTKTIKIEGDLTREQKERLMEIADRCPVHRTLMSSVQIISSQIE